MHGTHCQCKVTPAHLLILLATALFINGNQITPPSSYHHFFFFLVNCTTIFIPPSIGAQTHHFFFFLGAKLYHHQSELRPTIFILFFLGKLYHHWLELRPTIFFILLDLIVGTIISVLDPLISKIKKQTFQFKKSPKSLTHYSVFLSLSVSDFSSMASLVDLAVSPINGIARRLFQGKKKEKITEKWRDKNRGKMKRKAKKNEREE